MPPFVPRKRVSSEDPPPAKRQAQAHNDIPAKPVADSNSSSESDSELSDLPEGFGESNSTPVAGPAEASDDEEDSDDEIDWEDAIDTKTTNTTPTLAVPELQDLELTLDKNETEIVDLVDPKKGPTKIERQIRIQSHCMHVQCLLFHNAIRNAWINDAKIHEILRKKLPEGIHKEVKKWRIASGLELPEKKPEPPKSKKKGKKARKSQDWGEDLERLEPGQPDMSRGDPIIILLKVLVAYWRKQFRITAPGLRKHGYRPVAALDMVLKDFHKEDHDPERHGERIANLEEFRATAESMQGSRDVGAQLFTALIRALGIEARLVGSLQPLGFGWTKAEIYTPPKTKKEQEQEKEQEKATSEAAKYKSESDADSEPKESKQKKGRSAYDNDLFFPIYWTEVASPVTHEITSVDPIVLSNPLAPTADLQAAFEPRGAKAEKAKQVICYVVAHSADGTAKDVTTRYLKRRTWPGKTKGFRMPVDKIPIPGRRGEYLEFDWFRVVMRGYERPPQKRTEVDKLEDEKDLQRKQPEKKKPAQTGDTLQSLRTSTEFILERFLRREEALKPGSESVRTFTSGKGARAKEELVYLRADVVKCMSAESWHKEGRQVQPGSVPLKRVPIRAVTLMRKREVEELQRETGEKPMQGLYSRDQTEYIIPPPSSMESFRRTTTEISTASSRLGIDYAEAVTGFEFGSKMAVPVIQGVVVASENADLLRDAWRVDAAEKRKREELKAEKRILQTWRKFLFGLRIAERVREEYGGGDPADDRERETHNPFVARKKTTVDDVDERHFHDESVQDRAEDYDPVEHGGGFLLPGEGDDGDDDLIVEHHKDEENPVGVVSNDHGDEDDSSGDLSPPISIPSTSDEEGDDSEPEYAPSRNSRRRRRGG
ncbi:Rad4 beta-hairpin domain 1 [Penicillium frequentans]|nr:Rad4 beta-hairpin domain 1 [Penicillium glabrum]